MSRIIKFDENPIGLHKTQKKMFSTAFCVKSPKPFKISIWWFKHKITKKHIIFVFVISSFTFCGLGLLFWSLSCLESCGRLLGCIPTKSRPKPRQGVRVMTKQPKPSRQRSQWNSEFRKIQTISLWTFCLNHQMFILKVFCDPSQNTTQTGLYCILCRPVSPLGIRPGSPCHQSPPWAPHS